MELPLHIFREYDIRGIVDSELTDQGVRDLGRAAAVTFLREDMDTAVVGRDVRHSGERFFAALTEGLMESGIDVVDIGAVPTPVFYFASRVWDIPAGIMITASHNPSEYNGFKILRGEVTIYGDQIRELHEIARIGDFADSSEKGSLSSRDASREYIEYLINNISLERPVKFAVDGGNGTAGLVAPEIFSGLGCQPDELFMEPDGSFPNHHPDPTVRKNLKWLVDSVRENKLELGIGFDGDSDRIGVVDEQGNIIWGDALLSLFSSEVLRENPGATVIFEVKCSRALEEDIINNGGKPLMWKTGHSLLKNKMLEEGSLIAGEMSGHQFFADRYFGFDDAIYAACRLLEIVSAREKPLSDFYHQFTRYRSTPEIRVECEEKEKFDIVREVSGYFSRTNRVTTVDGARVDFEKGWGLIRASNTQPVLVFRFEAETEEALKDIQDRFSEAIDKYDLDTTKLYAR
ncbi:MAG: phosphomannomutase [Candidatus Latescibacteria bacterium]|nr:phosphomannomutase [bacterium]MBD3425242.1 phosphomannomutase [Candidatus Latescibacterota bacterium]